jgi:hypothetical protein
MTKQISINEIRIDGGTQLRQEIDYVTVGDYAAAFAAGAKFPPLVVFYDGVTYWLADGFHRWHAAKKQEIEKLVCEVRQGSQRDAILFAAGANTTNGLRRSNADKRVAVMKLLHDPEWSKKADKWIAEAAAVSQPFVSDQRRQCKSVIDSDSPRVVERRDGKKYTVKTKPRKKPDMHVPPIDEEVSAPKLEVTPRSPLTKKPKSFDAERNLVRALADLSSLIKRTHYDADIDKGRIAHELNELANEVAEAIEEAEAA